MKKKVSYLILVVLAAVACTSEKDVFDPNYNKELGMTVPEGFEWSTTQDVTVNAAVDDEYNGKYYYAIRVYDKAPAPGILPIAASGEVTGEMPFSQRVVIPATISKLYISKVFKQANAKEVITTKEVTINGATVECSFGTPKRSRSIKARGNKISLTTGKTITTSGEYYIPAGEIIHVNAVNGNLKDVEIEVDGTLIFDGDASLHEWEIDVEDHGTVEVNGNLVLIGNKNDEGKSSSLENEGYVHITGNLTVQAGASLDNDDNDDGKYMGGCIIVDGDAHFQSNKIELDERSYMSCRNMKLNGSNMRIYMETGAWLRVTGELTSAQNCEIGFGDDEKFEKPDTDDKIKDTKYVALIQVGSWGNQGKGNLTTREEILVECKEKGKHNIVSWTEDASKEITIVGSTCSGSIGDDEETAAPVCTYVLEDQEIDKGDYDMNDIVVVVTSNQYNSGKKTWTINGQVVAAGATNKIVPYFQYGLTGEKEYLFPGKGTVYEAFGLSGSPVPVNTDAADGKKADSVPFSVELEDVDSNPQIDMLNFGIEVKGESINWKEHGKGSAARALQVAALFKYPKERIRITEAYPGFSEWVNANKSRSASWYEDPVENYVITPKLK